MRTVIPAINAASLAEAEEKIARAENFAEWVHFDLADGSFTANVLWGTAPDIVDLQKEFPKPFFEVHLMTRAPFQYVPQLLEAGVERVIVHAEAVTEEEVALQVKDKRHFMLSLLPETQIESVIRLLPHFSQYQILSVHPGRSGQPFQESVLPKIQFLRGYLPDATIEVDGGVDERTAARIIRAGADTLVSASYIFNNPSPEEAYERLLKAQ